MWIGNIELQTELGTFTIPVRSKYTVLQGRSAQGKTSNITHYTLTFNIKTTHVVSSIGDFFQYLESDIPVGVIDEDLVKGLTQYVGMMNESNKQFILITRQIPGSLAVDYRDIYEVFGYKKRFVCVRKYPDFERFVVSDTILCEDSKSSKFYLDSKFEKVESAYGAPRLTDKLATIEGTCTVFADGSAIGAYIDGILEYTVNLYLPISYEYLCLHHEFNFEVSEDTYRDWKPDEYVSLERLCTAELNRLTRAHPELYGSAYGKSLPQSWINRIPWQKLFDLGQSDFEQWLQRFAYPEDIGKPMTQLWEKYKHVYNLGKKGF